MRFCDLRPFMTELVVLGICAFATRALSADHKPLRVAVIDTGIDLNTTQVPLCPGLSRDFTGQGIMDTHGHGTHISDTIDQYAKNSIRTERYGYTQNNKRLNSTAKYCQIVLKFYAPSGTGEENTDRSSQALEYAAYLGVDVLNYSGGGSEYSTREAKAVRQLLNQGTHIVAAAGNERSNITIYPFFPASYDSRIYVIGNLDIDNYHRQLLSNYGSKVRFWEMGTNVIGALPHATYGYMTGTSQAAAIFTGKLVHSILSRTSTPNAK